MTLVQICPLVFLVHRSFWPSCLPVYPFIFWNGSVAIWTASLGLDICLAFKNPLILPCWLEFRTQSFQLLFFSKAVVHVYLLLGPFFLKSWHCYAKLFWVGGSKVQPHCGLCDIMVSGYDLGSYFNVTLWDSLFLIVNQAQVQSLNTVRLPVLTIPG